jgi:2-polyprenyl-3-methyl-5-hydroxy-6-metoxy-1,4-benzoquinol methylase
MLKKIIIKISYILMIIRDELSLSDKGERVDINYNKDINWEKLDIYQKSHLKRYEFAKQLMDQNDAVGDFACGTGYGTLILSEKSAKVIGVDINKKVISIIKRRYKKNKNVEFITSNILDLKYENYFDKIVSFETVEHLDEKDTPCIFNIFFKALKNNGKLIFSVPYIQEKSEEAIKMGFHKTFYIE